MNQIEKEIDHEWLEIEGKNREDALERACIALNTTKAYLDFEFTNDKQTKLRARKSEEQQTRKASPKKPLKNKKDKPKDRVHAKEDKVSNDSFEDDVEDTEWVDPTEMGKNAKAVLSHILSYIDDSVDVDLKESKNKIYLDVMGDGTGLVIGKRGQTLEALQHVVAKSIGLDRHSDKRLVLDAEGYRERRQESLRSLAYKMASKACKDRRSVSLEPMSAMDRRVVHMALVNNRQISTKSVGEGLGRKVLIVPNNARKTNSSGNNGESRSYSKYNDQNKGPRSSSDQGNVRLASGSTRMHDSYDVPHAPNMDVFPDNIDELAELPEHELQEYLPTDSVTTQASEPSEKKPLKKAKLVTRQSTED